MEVCYIFNGFRHHLRISFLCLVLHDKYILQDLNPQALKKFIAAGGSSVAVGHVVQLQRREYFESASKVGSGQNCQIYAKRTNIKISRFIDLKWLVATERNISICDHTSRFVAYRAPYLIPLALFLSNQEAKLCTFLARMHFVLVSAISRYIRH
jgi:ribosomal protein L27